MSQLAALLGKLGPKLGALVQGARGTQGAGLADLLKQAAANQNAAGPSQMGQSLGQMGNIVQDAGELGGMAAGGVGRVKDVLTADSPTKAIAGGLRAVGDTGGMVGTAIGGAVGGPAGAAIGGAVGEAAGAVPKFVAAMVESIDKLREFGKTLQANNLAFADVSASMAKLQAEVEVETFLRRQQQGENRAGSAAFQSGGAQRLEQTMAPIEDLWSNIQNYLSGALDHVVAGVIEGMKIDLFAKVANALLGTLASTEDKPPDEMTAYLERLAEEARNRRPPNMR